MLQAVNSLRKPRGRRSDAPSEHLARVVWILTTLLSERVLDCARCIERFGITRRAFQRDLRKLREIGTAAGFAITKTRSGRVFLEPRSRGLERLSFKSRDVTATLTRLARSLGGPIEREIREAVGGAGEDSSASGFLHLRGAVPSDGDRVCVAFSFLKGSADASARVEFTYAPGRGASTMRRVEPYHVVARSGRYYLIAYDLIRRDWRQFALDAIARPMQRAGMFAPRTVPERLLAQGAVGWIRAGAPADVRFRVNSVIASAVTAQVWQPAQRVRPLPDGAVEITLSFQDMGEAVRWALQFGTEAVVLSPPEAVALARRTAERIAVLYNDLPENIPKSAAG